MLLFRFESSHIQPPYLAAGHLEELAQDLITNVGFVTVLGDQAAELELDDVVDLLLGEVLHR